MLPFTEVYVFIQITDIKYHYKVNNFINRLVRSQTEKTTLVFLKTSQFTASSCTHFFNPNKSNRLTHQVM